MRLRTADYSEEARRRLGEAVRIQREADGYKYRPAFADVANVSLRSLADIEQGKPGVGETNLRAVGRALSTWTEDTARAVLEDDSGKSIPPTKLPPVQAEPASSDMTGADAELEQRRIEIAAMTDEQIWGMAERIRAASGVDAARQWIDGAFGIKRRARDETLRNPESETRLD